MSLTWILIISIVVIVIGFAGAVMGGKSESPSSAKGLGYFLVVVGILGLVWYGYKKMHTPSTKAPAKVEAKAKAAAKDVAKKVEAKANEVADTVKKVGS